MLCPICKIELKMSERQGVEIDYCPDCRGVWLDRGELDKIIEKSSMETSNRPSNSRSDRDEKLRRERYDDDDDDYRGSPRRKRSFLGDLFEFGD